VGGPEFKPQYCNKLNKYVNQNKKKKKKKEGADTVFFQEICEKINKHALGAQRV
jgi:hypothetical protein